jgi:integrase
MTFNGKRQSAVFDHKPTESEVMLAFSKKINSTIKCTHITFETAANEYCKLRKNVLSPKTYREYMRMPQRLSSDFITLYIDEIDNLDIQNEVNTLSATRKPKTVKNYYDFIISVMRMYIKNYAPDVTVPEVMVEKKYIPTDKEVKLLFDSAMNHESGMFFIPIVLGSYGLRRSEICALECDDIVGNVVYIKKSMVQDDDNNWIIKEYPKNSTSIRRIPIDSEIANMIHEQGYVYNGHPNSISDYIAKFCDRNNITHFSLHKLRHYFCSRLVSEGIDTKTAITMSGHSTDSVFKRIYVHEVDEKVQEASSKLDSILFGDGHKWSQNKKEC